MTDSAKRVGVIGLPGGWSTEALADACAERTGTKHLIDMAQVSFHTGSGKLLWGDVDLCEFDALVLKKLGKEYSPAMLDRLELLDYAAAKGVRVFSNPASMLRLIDRLSCTVALRKADIPLPATVITECPESAAAAVREFGSAVLKPLYSTKARGMGTFEGSSSSLEADIRDYQAAGNPVLYVQQMIEIVGARDYGIGFVGGQYFGSYARVRTNDSWNTTTHAGGKYAAFEPDADLIELARRAQAPFELDFTVVDIAVTGQGPVVFEVSAFGGFRGLRDAAGIDAAALYADYVMEQISR